MNRIREILSEGPEQTKDVIEDQNNNYSAESQNNNYSAESGNKKDDTSNTDTKRGRAKKAKNGKKKGREKEEEKKKGREKEEEEEETEENVAASGWFCSAHEHVHKILPRLFNDVPVNLTM